MCVLSYIVSFTLKCRYKNTYNYIARVVVILLFCFGTYHTYHRWAR